jgi:hypothetical protein
MTALRAVSRIRHKLPLPLIGRQKEPELFVVQRRCPS